MTVESYADWLRRSLEKRDWRVVMAIFDEMTEEEWKECLLELAGIETEQARR